MQAEWSTKKSYWQSGDRPYQRRPLNDCGVRPHNVFLPLESALSHHVNQVVSLMEPIFTMTQDTCILLSSPNHCTNGGLPLFSLIPVT